MEYDRHILNSTNRMRTSWNLINMELGKDMNNLIIQSINTDGKTSTDHQSIADTFNKHFILIPYIINPLNTKRSLLYLKAKFVLRSKHFSSWL